MKSAVSFALLVSVVGTLVAGCTKSATAPSSTATTTEIFVGSLDVKGSVLYGFNTNGTGATSVTLASVTSGPLNQPAGKALTVGVGDPPSETECNILNSQTLTPALVTQFTAGLTAGVHCIQIADPGTLTEPVNFAVKVVHP